jgi:hypothetical protein
MVDFCIAWRAKLKIQILQPHIGQIDGLNCKIAECTQDRIPIHWWMKDYGDLANS